MNEGSNKKKWERPEVRRIAPTDELLELMARQARVKAPLPIKRPK